MSSININQINNFTDFNSFSYKAGEKAQTYSSSNQQKRFTNSYLAVNRNGEIVISFQNKITRFFGQFFHVILKKLHIRHETTNSKDVWQALKNNKIIKDSLPYPITKKIREVFAQIILQYVKGAHQKANPDYHPLNDNTMKQFQKYVYLLDQNEHKDINKLLNSLNDLNGYFDKCIDTPLTLALKKESFETLQYLFNLKNKQGAQLIDPNKPTKDGRSPLLVAASKDLPRKYFMLLFQSGAIPKDEKEVQKIVQLAVDNQALIRAIRNAYERKAIDWPEPKRIELT